MKLTLEKNPCCLSYTANTMPADALVTLGASASAGKTLALKAGLFRLYHQKSSYFEAKPKWQPFPNDIGEKKIVF